MGEKSSSSGSLHRRPVPPPPEEEEIEEGEIHRGGGGYYDSGSETEDDDGRYVFQSRRDEEEEEEEEGMHPTSKRRRLEDILAETRGAVPLPSPTPSSGSEGTISDHGDGIVAGAGAAPVAREAFPCHVCNKEFGSRKAVHGHMRVHQAEKDKDKDKEPSLHLALGWAWTGKRGANGNARAVTVAFAAPMEQVVDDDDTRAIVLAPVHQPQPMAAAVARTNLDEPSSAVMVAEANPPNQVVDNHHLPAAAPYVGSHHRAPVQCSAALLPEAGQGGPYRCKFPGCNMEYKTHQGLGGHVAGHINREKQAAAAAAVQGGSGGGLGGARPEGRHPCRKCGQEFLTGVALGGHMRKHYDPKKKHDDLVLTLSVAPPTPAPAPAIAAAALPPAETNAEVAEHEAEPVPVPAPAPPPAEVRRNVVRIFGVDIEKPADEEEQDGGSD